MKMTRIMGAAAALFTASLILAPGAKAQNTNPIGNLTYYVTLSNLNALPTTAGENSLDFQLLTGSGNVTNTVTLSNFVINGGSFDASNGNNYTVGNESGSPTSSLVLTSLATNNGSSSIDNEFDEAFTAGVTSISFKVTATPNDEVLTSGTAIDDQFNIDIQDGNGNYITTLDPSSGNNLLVETIASTNTVASVNTFNSASPDAGVTGTVSAVPEPSSYALFGLGALALLVIAVRRRAA